ncbi:hypothetical protein DW352_00085 [Pseudolabrys taiwanensis]|uniref:Tetratricopeptide repeat protein n=1 Tax=Pseudolabrys taiwanensis TaxID=331696 RepID=A0A345ZQ59_9HYPH|nr:hypothetical protein [Pseudolabrys taiwanensis]AXK79056.1 hypothetical protein DW352_00085 [Pseudolabrys taiwanensis]
MNDTADLARPPATVEAGCEVMRRAVAVLGVDHLYDEHFRSFGYPADIYKPRTVKGLTDRLAWQTAIDILIRATTANPDNIEGKHQLALMLEHLGQVDHASDVRAEIAKLNPSYFPNNIAVGRLMEFSKPMEAVRRHYANACATPSSYSLALARSVAINGPQILDKTSLAELLVKIESSKQSPADDILLDLAMGFVSLAKSDSDSARQYFAAACMLSDARDGSPTYCDEWSLAYARAYLVDLVPPGRTAVPNFATINPVRLALACASQQRAQGASIPVLCAFETAIDRVLPRPPTLNHRLYHGYRIAQLEGRYYAIPREVADFFLFRGRVYRQPPTHYDRISSGREMVASQMRPSWRRFLKSIYFNARSVAAHLLNALRNGKHAARRLARLSIEFYMRRYEIPGVLVDSEYAGLQQSVDRSTTKKSVGLDRMRKST